MKYIRKVLACLRKADERYALIDDNDRIVLGISGGKDSLCLLKAMSIYGKFSSKNFKIYPVCLDLGFPDFNSIELEKYCSSLGLKLRVIDCKEIYPISVEHKKEDGHLPCSICGRMRKAAINLEAKKLKANKVAFAHHRDDAIETLFMNMIHGGRVATFEPKMYLSRAKITFIRPLIECSELDLIGMANEENLPVMKKICPADGFTERQYIKDFLKDLYSSRSDSVTNLAEMLSNDEGFKLYFNLLETTSTRIHSLSYKRINNVDDFKSLIEFSNKENIKLSKKISKAETILLLKNHKIIGYMVINNISTHSIEFVDFECLGSKEEKEEFLKLYIETYSRKVVPVTYIYSCRKDKKIASMLGFSKKANKMYSLKIVTTHPF